MREIVLDTETTGIDPAQGHRIIEIGALEIVNQTPTGAQLHLYINPEREVEAGALEVHGLSNEFLEDKPLFADIVDEFLEFIGDDSMVIHNAPFDMGFINSELKRSGARGTADEPCHRYAEHGAPQVSRRAGQSECALPQVRYRQQPP